MTLPRLEAEESLMAAQRTALGSGTLTRQAAARLDRQLVDQARGTGRRPAVSLRPDQAAALGIGYVVTKDSDA